MGKPIVILSETRDLHLPYVLKHLTLPTIVIDILQIVRNTAALTYEVKGNGLVVVYGDQIIKKAHAVWFRKPRPVSEVSLPVPKNYRRYSQSALSRHMLALTTCFSDSFWLSDYYAMSRANNKPWQLTVAAQVGMKIPETIFTSSKSRAEAFVKAHGETIVKTAARNLPISENGHSTSMYAQKVVRNKRFSGQGLHLAPTIFQEAIEAQKDIRVTVVDKRVFAAAIELEKTDPHSKVRDWRSGIHTGGLHITAYELPRKVQRQCIEIVQQLGLRFGAIDLVLDPHGQYWFLENNPNGQWAFVEDATGQSIGQAIAELLTKK